jgi:hypothetical protein
LTPFDEPFAVLVLGSVSHPINTEVESKLLGGLRCHGESSVLLTASSADEHAPHCLAELTLERRAEITTILNRSYPGEWGWLTVEDVEPQLHAATLRHRQKQDGATAG